MSIDNDVRIVRSNDSVSSAELAQPESLCKKKVLAYGLGHFYNDLCACLWFMYLVLFLQKVAGFSPPTAGYLMLLGQITDALATPLTGIITDAVTLHPILRRYGRRKTFHLIGTLCVTMSFPLLFGPCRLCNDSTSELAHALYYAPSIILFQVGWAIVQISHLALIPEIAMCESDRTTLNSVRFGFTVLAQMIVFGIVFGLLGLDTGRVSSADSNAFQNMDLIVVGIGCYVATLFHYGIKESATSRRLISESLSYTVEGPPSPQHPVSINKLSDASVPKMSWTDWLREHQFYQVALLYMLSRLFINVPQIYLPFYIQYSQDFRKAYVAIFPLVICVTSFVVSCVMSVPCINRLINRKANYILGVVVGLGASGWMWVQDMHYLMYGVAVFLGIAQSTLLVTSLAFTADLINKNSESGAFVYGAMSFLDKLANGLVCCVIQILKPMCHATEGHHSSCSVYYRNVMVFVPCISLVLATIVLLTLLPQKVGQRSNRAGRIILVNEE